MPLQNADQFGAFVQTTQIWDLGNMQDVDVNSPEFKELLVRLYQQINNIVNVLNIKDTGMYQLSEFVNGQVFFANPDLNNPVTNPNLQQSPEDRQVMRKVINFGILPNAGLKSIAHGITCTTKTTFTRIYGAASDVIAAFHYIPLPYADAAGVDNIQLDVDATNVNVTTASNRTNFTITYIVLEYIQS